MLSEDESPVGRKETAASVSGPAPARGDELAPGWEAAKTEGGQCYFWHTETLKTVWTRPTIGSSIANGEVAPAVEGGSSATGAMRDASATATNADAAGKGTGVEDTGAEEEHGAPPAYAAISGDEVTPPFAGSMPKDAAAEQRSKAGLVVACAAYTIAGPALILLNNHIMHGLAFPYPIALSAFGVTFSALVCRLLVLSRLVPPTRPELAHSNRFFFATTLPLAALAALTLGLGNSVTNENNEPELRVR